MSRGRGARKPCDVQQARQRLVDARQFLEAADLLDAPDVGATCAIHAAIAAADAITCHARTCRRTLPAFASRRNEHRPVAVGPVAGVASAEEAVVERGVDTPEMC